MHIRTFENPTALAMHKSWHNRKAASANSVSNEVQDGEEVDMEMELDPMAMLEVGIGDEPVEVELPEGVEGADEEENSEGRKHSVDRMLGKEGENGVEGEDEAENKEDPLDAEYDQLNTPEAIDINESDAMLEGER